MEDGVDAAELATREAGVEVALVEIVADRAPSRFRYFVPSVRSSTATMSSMPIALRPWTRLLPIMPAAPVTTTLTRFLAGEELLVADAGGPELADDDAAGAVGDRHRVAQPEAAGQHRGQRGDDGVAGAGHVEDLARLGRHLQRDRLASNSDMPSSERVSSRPSSPSAAQLLRLRVELRRARPGADHLRQLGPVGRDHGRAGVARIVAALGIDQHRLGELAGLLDHARDVRQAALAVVGEQDRVVGRQRRSYSARHAREHLVIGLVLEVDPEQLLGPADDAQLDDRVELGVAAEQQPHALRFEQSRAAPRRFVGRRPRVTSVARAPSVLTLRATLAAPPRRSSSRLTRTTGTGASGEMRSTAPNQ